MTRHRAKYSRWNSFWITVRRVHTYGRTIGMLIERDCSYTLRMSALASALDIPNFNASLDVKITLLFRSTYGMSSNTWSRWVIEKLLSYYIETIPLDYLIANIHSWRYVRFSNLDCYGHTTVCARIFLCININNNYLIFKDLTDF